MTEENKYACFKTFNVDNRCIKVIDNYKGTTYPNIAECMRNCNSESEEIALKKLKDKYKLKDLIEYIKPKLSVNLPNLNDIPILNYNKETYNKKVFDSDEIKTFYSLLVTTENDKFVFTNLFFEKFIETSNCILGTSFHVNIISAIKNRKINYSFDDIEKDYIYHFMDEKYKKDFDIEIKTFVESTKLFFIKPISIQNNIIKIGHQAFMIIKKNTSILNVFIYDPISDPDSTIMETFEEFFKIQFKDKYKHTFFNLSKIYGIQDFEQRNPINKHFLEIVDIHSKSLLLNLQDFLNFAEDIYLESTKDLINFKNIVYSRFFIGLSENHILKLDIDKVIDIIFEIINLDIKSYRENSYKIYDSTSSMFISNSLTPKFNELIIKEQELGIKKNELIKKYNENRQFDYFENLCQLWCYYTIVLMLINPDIDPYTIIKSSFYQSTNSKNIERLYEAILIRNEEKKSNDSMSFLFDNDFIEKQEKHLEELKEMIIPDEKNSVFDEHFRILYIKITNFIILNILYNRTFDKYLLYSIGINDKSNDIFRIKMIPEKVNKMLDDFNFDTTEMTASKIFSIIKTGKKFLDVNSDILKTKEYKLVGGSIFYKKYLKYKNKYLKLKKIE